MIDIELKLPDDVLENIPQSKDDLLKYLASYFDRVIDRYDMRFQKRVAGMFGQPLSRYERSMLKDFLIDIAIGKLQEDAVISADLMRNP